MVNESPLTIPAPPAAARRSRVKTQLNMGDIKDLALSRLTPRGGRILFHHQAHQDHQEGGVSACAAAKLGSLVILVCLVVESCVSASPRRPQANRQVRRARQGLALILANLAVKCAHPRFAGPSDIEYGPQDAAPPRPAILMTFGP
jgi:hypothetical protein